MSCLPHFESAVTFLTEKTEPVSFDQQLKPEGQGQALGSPRPTVLSVTAPWGALRECERGH